MTDKARRLPDWLQNIREAIRNVRGGLGSLTTVHLQLPQLEALLADRSAH